MSNLLPGIATLPERVSGGTVSGKAVIVPTLVSAVYFVEAATVKCRSSTTLATVHSESVNCLPAGQLNQIRSPTFTLALVKAATVIVLTVAPDGFVMVS